MCLKNTLRLMLTGAVCLVTAASASTTWNVGDLFLGTAGGSYQVRDQAGNLKETLSTGRGGFTTGCAFDANDNLYITEFGAGNVSAFAGPASPHTNTIFASGLTSPEMVVFDGVGNVYIGQVGGTRGINQYSSGGGFIKTIAAGSRVDFFDIAADGDTIAYGQEGNSILTASISTGTQGSDFTTGTATQAFALRYLPDGGILLADLSNIKRYNSVGVIIDTYDVTGENQWFALNLDPDGSSFWAGSSSTGIYYKFNIATGGVDVHTAGPFDTGVAGNFNGLCILGEPTVIRPGFIPEPVPAQSQYGLFIFVLLLLCTGLIGYRRLAS